MDMHWLAPLYIYRYIHIYIYAYIYIYIYIEEREKKDRERDLSDQSLSPDNIGAVMCLLCWVPVVSKWITSYFVLHDFMLVS